MPNPKRADRPYEKRINIPTSLVKRVNEALADTFTKRPQHGAWSRLTCSLLRLWLAGKIKIPGVKRRRNLPFCPNCLLNLPVNNCQIEDCPTGAYDETHSLTEDDQTTEESMRGIPKS